MVNHLCFLMEENLAHWVPVESIYMSILLSSLRKVFITGNTRNKLSPPHHSLNSLLFVPDGYPTVTEDPVEIKVTVRSGTIGGGYIWSGWEHRDWVPRIPFGKNVLHTVSASPQRGSATPYAVGSLTEHWLRLGI